MPANDFAIGALYPPPKGIGQIWSQPGGIGTQVFPAQPTGNSDILSIEPYSALTGTFMFGCGHSCNMVYTVREIDVTDNTPVALLLCAQCGFCQRIIKPWSDAFIGSVSYLENAILYP